MIRIRIGIGNGNEKCEITEKVFLERVLFYFILFFKTKNFIYSEYLVGRLISSSQNSVQNQFSFVLLILTLLSIKLSYLSFFD